jgi:hypothetical protein
MSDETKEPDEKQDENAPDGYARDNTVKLTMVSNADGVMSFFLRRTPTTAMALKRREHLGKPEKEQAAERMSHYVDLVADLTVEAPVGVKDFPADSRPLLARVRDFFADASNDALLKSVVEGWWTGTQPVATFLSSVSGSR